MGSELEILIDNGNEIKLVQGLSIEEGTADYSKYSKIKIMKDENEAAYYIEKYLNENNITSIGNKTSNDGCYMVIGGSKSMMLQLVSKPNYTNISSKIIDTYLKDKESFMLNNKRITNYNITGSDNMMSYYIQDDSINIIINNILEQEFLRKFIFGKCESANSMFEVTKTDELLTITCGEYTFRVSLDFEDIINSIKTQINDAYLTDYIHGQMRVFEEAIKTK